MPRPKIFGEASARGGPTVLRPATPPQVSAQTDVVRSTLVTSCVKNVRALLELFSDQRVMVFDPPAGTQSPQFSLNGRIAALKANLTANPHTARRRTTQRRRSWPSNCSPISVCGGHRRAPRCARVRDLLRAGMCLTSWRANRSRSRQETRTCKEVTSGDHHDSCLDRCRPLLLAHHPPSRTDIAQ
jgi:hypothetical protein